MSGDNPALTRGVAVEQAACSQLDSAGGVQRDALAEIDSTAE